VVLGLVVISAVVLLAAVPTLYIVTRRAEQASRMAIVDVCEAELSRIPPSHIGTISREALQLKRRYRLADVTLGPAAQNDANTIVRQIGNQFLVVRFNDESGGARRLVQVGAASAAVAAIAGLYLLLSNVRGFFAAPNERGLTMTAGAFESSMRSLRTLRDQEKERADELARVTRTLVRSLTSGFISIDPDGVIVDVNEQARELLGLDNRDVQGQRVTAALGQSAFARTLAKAVEERTTYQREEISDRDEPDRVFGLTTVPLVDERDRYFGMLVLFVDLTLLRKLEGQLRAMQSLADLGEMSAGIAHEFRNSLSTVIGYLRLARRDPLPDGIEERLARAETEAHLLNTAVESLLSFARPVALQSQPIDAMAVVRSAAEQQSNVTPGVTITVTGPSIPIDGDAALLHRAFENLLRNAVEAIQARETPGGGQIRIEATRSAESSRITISDNGVGLNTADAARLFLPFQSGKPNGFGLGLALVKKVVVLHGGSIRLEGAPGAGATVTIELPVRL
jgi:PAS domain S-box-containing protein